MLFRVCECSLKAAQHAFLSQAYMTHVHAPLLSRPLVQLLVILTFITTLTLSLMALPSLSVGLDQAVALPRDSFLQHYFRWVGGGG